MKKPITLYVSDYYNKISFEDQNLKLEKTKSLLKEDNNNAVILASVEEIENYTCKIKDIDEKYTTRASKILTESIKNNEELVITVANCKIHSYAWDDEKYHFRFYWFIISDKHMLQLVAISDPKYSEFYKYNFMRYFQATEIDLSFDFSNNKRAKDIFEINKIEVDIQDLQERIDLKHRKEEKVKFLEENLKVSKPNFYKVLEAELKLNHSACIENFICKEWNVYYDLYNPENFSNPDSTEDWEDNSDVFEYYEKPYSNAEKLDINKGDENFNLNFFKKCVKNKETIEQNLINFFEHYTFGNGGAYAEAIHYEYAKIEIERLHKTTYTKQEFLKRNICINTISISEKTNELMILFDCSWDSEHGIEIIVDNNFECKAYE